MLTAPGDHYGSIMQSLDVTIKRSSQEKEELLRLVAKLIPASELLRAMFDIQVTFKKEVSAYLDAIPALIDFQREYNVAEDRILDIFPKCYGARINLNNNNGDVDDDAAIILENLKCQGLENLKCQGYETGDRFVGFDYAHAELIVKDLAKFHAIPIAMQKLKPKEFKRKA
ncbi:Ecdysteroid kinase-like family [Popillia japonica]|uniref:Ecdysteroid kinase-like family n=1 Tax=Popillia japonica TaxID=7064 RepID=A0AAW1NBB6_POPJA